GPNLSSSVGAFDLRKNGYFTGPAFCGRATGFSRCRLVDSARRIEHADATNHDFSARTPDAGWIAFVKSRSHFRRRCLLVTGPLSSLILAFIEGLPPGNREARDAG